MPLRPREPKNLIIGLKSRTFPTTNWFLFNLLVLQIGSWQVSNFLTGGKAIRQLLNAVIGRAQKMETRQNSVTTLV